MHKFIHFNNIFDYVILKETLKKNMIKNSVCASS